MAGAAEQLQIVRILPDGSYMWHEALSAPGVGRSALLLDLLASDAVAATEFEITENGDWLATVAGVRYNILPGVIPDTGRFVFIGVRSPVTVVAPPPVPPVPPIIKLEDYSDEFNRPNGDPGAHWTLHTSGSGYLSIVNNELTATAANEQQLGWWNLALPSPQWDHRVQVRIGSAVPTITYLLVRASESDGHVRAQVYGTGRLELLTCEGDLISGTLQERAVGASAPLTPGRIVSLEAEGAAYILKIDGLEVSRWTDTGGVWSHVDDAHLNVVVGLNVASLTARSLTSRAAMGMSIDNFAATLVEPEVTTDTNVDARFGGAGTLSAELLGPNEARPQFTGDGALTAEITSAVLANFTGTGALTAIALPPDVHLAAFTGDGSLTATVQESNPADFTGEGALTATAEIGVSREPMSNFDFHEGSGSRTDATIGAYNLIPDDPAAAWNGEKAQGTFRGIVGAGRQSEWTAALWMTYTSLTYAPYDIEVGSASKIGLNCSNNPPGVFPGLWTAGGWVYSTTPVGTWDNPFLLVCVNSVADGIQTLYLNGVSVLETPTPVERDFDVSADLTLTYPGNTLTVDNLTYWDVALTPAEVAALPPAPPVLPPLPPSVAAKFSGGGTLSQLASFVPEPYTDDFNRGDGPPGPGWEIVSDTNDDLVIKNNELAVVGTDALESRHAVWVQPLPGDDHKIEVTIGTDVASSYVLMVRLNKDDGHLRANFSADGSGVSFMPFEGGLMTGGGTSGGGGPTPPLVTGTVLGFEALGADYIAYVDGVEVARTAPAWNHIGAANRRVGVMIQSLPVVFGGNDRASIDNFNAAPPPPPPYNPDDYSDVFTRPDGVPGASWELWHSSGTEDLELLGNQMVVTTTVDEQHAWWVKPLPGDDHKVEFTVGATLPYQYYLTVRGSEASGNVVAIVEATGVAVIMTKEARNATTNVIRDQIPVGSGIALATGQVVSFEAARGHYIVRVNGAEILHWEDAADEWTHIGPANRLVGVGMLTAVVGQGALDDFRATDLGYQDNFDRADGPPGEDWILSSSGVGNLAVAGNELVASDPAEDQYGLWATPVPANDQQVQVVVGTTVPDTTKIVLRQKNGVAYVYGLIHKDGTTEIATVAGDLVTGTVTVQALDSTVNNLTTGQWLSFGVIGGEYVIRVDGLEKLSWPDLLNEFTYTTHRSVGVMLNGGSVDDFAYTDPTIHPYGEFGNDGFERPDGPLGPDWLVTYPWADPALEMTIKDNELYSTGPGESRALYLHPVPGDDHKVEITVGRHVAQSYHLQVRNPNNGWPQLAVELTSIPPPPGMGMEEYWGASIVQRSSPNDGGVAFATAPAWIPITTGDKLSFEAVGNTYTFKINGVVDVTCTGDQPIGGAYHHAVVGITTSGPNDYDYPEEGSADDFQFIDLTNVVEDAAAEATPGDTGG